TSYARHSKDALAGCVPWLLDRVCQVADPDLSAVWGAAPRPGRRWPLVAADTHRAPPGGAEHAADPPSCFPLAAPAPATGGPGLGERGRGGLRRAVAAVAADLACRIGLALDRAGQGAASPSEAGAGRGRPERGGAGRGGQRDATRLAGHKS